jgi:hypothetical protein
MEDTVKPTTLLRPLEHTPYTFTSPFAWPCARAGQAVRSRLPAPMHLPVHALQGRTR